MQTLKSLTTLPGHSQVSEDEGGKRFFPQQDSPSVSRRCNRHNILEFPRNFEDRKRVQGFRTRSRATFIQICIFVYNVYLVSQKNYLQSWTTNYIICVIKYKKHRDCVRRKKIKIHRKSFFSLKERIGGLKEGK